MGSSSHSTSAAKLVIHDPLNNEWKTLTGHQHIVDIPSGGSQSIQQFVEPAISVTTTIKSSESESQVMHILAGTVRAIGSVLPRNVEVVLHDLRHSEFSIAEIANAHVTGRKKGDSILAGMRADLAFRDVLEIKFEPISLLLDYQTMSKDGQPIRSSTAFYRNADGKAFAALCINVDEVGVARALEILQSLIGEPIENPASTEALHNEKNSPETPPDNIEALMSEIIKSASESSPGTSRADTKRANLLAVKIMQEKGVFLIKGGVEKAALALRVTRYTVYNYLDEIKRTSI